MIRGRKPKPAVVGVVEVDLRQYLTMRENVLAHQVSAIKGEIARKERDLAAVRTALRAIGETSSATKEEQQHVDK
jgi:hypothetical protein